LFAFWRQGRDHDKVPELHVLESPRGSRVTTWGIAMNSRLTLCAIAVVLSSLAGGCAIVVPVHTAGPPQSLGQRVGQVYMAAAFDPVLGPALNRFDLQGTPADSKADPQLASFGIRVGVLARLDVEFEATEATGSGSSAKRYGLKYQWLGKSLLESSRGDWVASLRARYITSTGLVDEDDDDIFGYPLVFDQLHARVAGLEQSFGYQLTDWAVLSLGVNWHRVSLRSRFREVDPADVWYEDRRRMSLFGANASLCLVPHGKRAAMIFCIEEGVQHLQHTFDSSRARNVPVSAVSLGIAYRF
jgi:hypothetical protein